MKPKRKHFLINMLYFKSFKNCQEQVQTINFVEYFLLKMNEVVLHKLK